jgi:hypothetical protein
MAGWSKIQVADYVGLDLTGRISNGAAPTWQNLFCANFFIPRFDLGLVVQNHVQQGIMDFQFSVVFDKTQFAEFVHEKAHA